MQLPEAWQLEHSRVPHEWQHFIKYRLPKPICSHRKMSLPSLMSLIHKMLSLQMTNRLTPRRPVYLHPWCCAGFQQLDEWTNWTHRWVNCLLLTWHLGPTQLVHLALARPDDCVKPCQEFTNANRKYPNYHKVGNIACMHVQFLPGSSFLRRPPKECEDEAIEE